MRAATGLPDFFTKGCQLHAKSSLISRRLIAVGHLLPRTSLYVGVGQLGTTDRLRRVYRSYVQQLLLYVINVSLKQCLTATQPTSHN